MERIDKVISNQTCYSRKDIKEMIRKKRICVNGLIISNSDFKVDVLVDEILVDGKEIKVKKNVYLMLNKPKGYISATSDNNMSTVLDLVPKEYLHRDLFPAGRLDKDTTGLMIITDDGVFAHNILSPQKHVRKTYYVVIDIPLTDDMVKGFEKGVILNDGECKSAKLKILSENDGIVTLTEGRYHQIKRMFGCYGAKVVELHRVGMGNFNLPDDLKLGECREFTEEELRKVQE
jgi:16S rRNA pseudouridine516 synthase